MFSTLTQHFQSTISPNTLTQHSPASSNMQAEHSKPRAEGNEQTAEHSKQQEASTFHSAHHDSKPGHKQKTTSRQQNPASDKRQARAANPARNEAAAAGNLPNDSSKTES